VRLQRPQRTNPVSKARPPRADLRIGPALRPAARSPSWLYQLGTVRGEPKADLGECPYAIRADVTFLLTLLMAEYLAADTAPPVEAGNE
jgi:hypothetical protein